MAGNRCLRDRVHRPLVRPRIIFGDHDDQRGDDKADDAAEKQVPAGDVHARDGSDRTPSDRQRCRSAKAEDRKSARNDQPAIERAHDRGVGAELDEESADDRGDDAGRADRQRIGHDGCEHRGSGEEDRCKHHRRHDGDRIGLEEVGGHAGAVADIVADVVGDCRRVARVVLGDACFDLADEVAADIGAFREDAAAETGEDRNQRRPEAERDKRIDDLARGRLMPEACGEYEVVDRDAQEGEAGHQHAGDCTGFECDVETGGETD